MLISPDPRAPPRHRPPFPASRSLVLFGLLALALGVALDVALPGVGDPERTPGHVLADHSAGASVCAVADADWCDERVVDGDSRTLPDPGAVLRAAVVVCGDAARADVRIG